MLDESDKRDFARHLRQQMNEYEAALWVRLRNRKQCRFKFRRQHPIGNYVADFWCPVARVVVELDGCSHAETKEHDAIRDAWMVERNIVVLRFNNRRLEESLERVLQEIVSACERQIV